MIKQGHVLNPHPADYDFCRFEPVLLVDQITDILGTKMCLNIMICKSLSSN